MATIDPLLAQSATRRRQIAFWVIGLLFSCQAIAQVHLEALDTFRLIVPQDSTIFYDTYHPEVFWDHGGLHWYEFEHRRLWRFLPDGRLDTCVFEKPWTRRSGLDRLMAPKRYRQDMYYEPWRFLPSPLGAVVVSWGIYVVDADGRLVLNRGLRHRWRAKGRKFWQDSFGNRDPAWVNSAGDILTVPVRSLRTDNVWPTRDSVFIFGLLHFSLDQKDGRPQLHKAGITLVADTTQILVDPLRNEVVGWEYCLDGEGGIYLGHHGTPTLRHVTAAGNIDLIFGIAPPLTHVPFVETERLPMRKLIFDRESLQVTTAKISKMYVEHHQFGELAYDTVSGMLFRVVQTGVPDLSDEAQAAKLQRPVVVQVYDLRDQGRFLGECSLPTNTYLVAADHGILYLRQRWTTDNKGIKIWRFRWISGKP